MNVKKLLLMAGLMLDHRHVREVEPSEGGSYDTYDSTNNDATYDAYCA